MMTNKEAANFLSQVKFMLLNSNSWLESTKTPIKKAFDMAISALQAQADGDCISRQSAIDVLGVFTQADALGHTPKQIVEALPSVKPERKTGWWLIREGISDAQCSECQMYFRDVYDMDNSDAFCRHCGTKMEGLKVIKNE